MGRELQHTPTIKDLFAGKQPEEVIRKPDEIREVISVLRRKREQKLSLIRAEARDTLQAARIPAKGVAWYEIRKNGANMAHKRMWAPIYGQSVREELLASVVIGAVKVVKHEPVRNLIQEAMARRKMRNFMGYIGVDRKETEEFIERSVDFSIRIQRRVGVKDDVKDYEEPKPPKRTLRRRR